MGSVKEPIVAAIINAMVKTYRVITTTIDQKIDTITIRKRAATIIHL